MSCSTANQHAASIQTPAGDWQDADASVDEKKDERKIIYSADITLSVIEPDTTNNYIQKIAQKYEGYISELGTHQTIIRVERDYLNDAMQEIEQLGKVKSKSISGKDVTEDYFDHQIRLQNAREARERYLELLEEAEDVETTLKVEKELERLNETIDLLKGKMNKIDHLSTYSTITVHLREKKKPGPLGYVFIGVYHTVKWLFVRN